MTFSIGPAEADSAAELPVRGQMTFRGANEWSPSASQTSWIAGESG